MSAALIMSKLKWQDWLLILDGLWVCASPWLLVDSPTIPMALNHLAVGAAVAGLAAARMQAWGSWPYVSLGAWLALSPLLWGYFSNLSIALSDLVAAAWIVLLGSRKIGNLTESKSE